jgi:hypothetical protein
VGNVQCTFPGWANKHTASGLVSFVSRDVSELSQEGSHRKGESQTDRKRWPLLMDPMEGNTG